MGGQCCSNTSTDQTNQLNTRTITVEEKLFFTKYPAIAEKLKERRTKQFLSDFKFSYFSVSISTSEQGIYIGERSFGSRVGSGVMLYNSGFYYQGEWKDDLRHGRGILIENTGDFYQGSWVEDMPEGQGYYCTYDGLGSYDGKWKKGLKDGQGKQQCLDLSICDGQYEKGIKHGRCNIIYTDGTFFKGTFKNGLAEGPGEEKGLNYHYIGGFHLNKMEGFGKCEFGTEREPKKDIYVGEYKNGQKHGYGEYRWRSGEVYKGKWEKGQIFNKGVYIQNSEVKKEGDPPATPSVMRREKNP